MYVDFHFCIHYNVIEKEQPISGYPWIYEAEITTSLVKVKGSYFLFPLIISRSSVTTIDMIINTNESISKSLMYTTSN